ncbi:MAG: MFS transporter [Candidatus Acididesulfobacter guangdongensis]|uniref:MFS transporter n=1 Tax=Acididesulfobacter guangdongensis TaxID=2597225 RepID=A0A519BES1_ACIG2|nr:MAG: MFS transporter [Candidatus Acididesulfobacter guangdongensis]
MESKPYLKTRLTEQSLKRFISILSAPRRWISIWFFAYALQGAVSSGLIPILTPLMIVALSHHLSWVAYVMGAFNLGLLTSPLWGGLADKKHLHRLLFFGGFIVLIGTLAALPFLRGLLIWCLLIFLAGAGTSAVATVATLFVVEFTPKTEWEQRLGWLQTFNGAGQVAGLFLAGIFVVNFKLGMLCSAFILLPALWIGAKGLPVKAQHHDLRNEIGQKMRRDLDWHFMAQFSHAELLGGDLIRFSHHLSFGGFRQMKKSLRTAFGRFLLSWFAAAFAVAAFFAYFPVAMQKAYDVAPVLTSSVYGLTAAAALALYALGGQLSSRVGAEHVYRWSLLTRLLGFALLAFGLFMPVPPIIPGLMGFVMIILAWPLLSISSTILTADLAPFSEGAAMGLYNAAGAIATVIGTFLSGPLIQRIGYPTLPIMGAAGIVIALLSGRGLLSAHSSLSISKTASSADKMGHGSQKISMNTQ